MFCEADTDVELGVQKLIRKELMKGKWEDAVLGREKHEPNAQTGQPLQVQQGAPE